MAPGEQNIRAASPKEPFGGFMKCNHEFENISTHNLVDFYVPLKVKLPEGGGEARLKF